MFESRGRSHHGGGYMHMRKEGGKHPRAVGRASVVLLHTPGRGGANTSQSGLPNLSLNHHLKPIEPAHKGTRKNGMRTLVIRLRTFTSAQQIGEASRGIDIEQPIY